MSGKNDDKPKMDFSKITSDIKNLQDKTHVDQIAPHVTDEYIQMARYKKDGKIFYKTKFNVEDAKKLGHKVVDALGYHLHLRHFDMSPAQYEELKRIKDKLGNSYVDTLLETHFKVDRNRIVNALAEAAEDEDEISHKTLESLLKKPVENYTQYILSKKLSDIEPKHIDSLKAYIKELGKTYNIDPKILKKTERTHDIQDLVGQYMGIVQQYYHEGKKK